MKGNVGEKLRFDHPRNRSTMKKHLVRAAFYSACIDF